jgi:SAM-dependent methyltransferase
MCGVRRSKRRQIKDFGLETHHFQIDWAVNTILRLVEEYDFETVLDIGSGAGEHTRFFRHYGKQVFSVDLDTGADYVGDFNALVLDRQFDVVWCSHVLEHQRNVGNFLEKIYAAVKDDTGILALTVPVHPRQRLLCGHITSWNAGLLCYNLVLAGFDCSEARALQTAYELGLIVRKKRAIAPEIGQSAAFHMPDQLNKLAKFFPFPVSQSANAEVLDVNWGERNYELPPAAHPGEIKITSRSSELA